MVVVIYTTIFILTFPILFMRDRLAGTVYGALFLYSIFAIVGYLYFPGYSESILAYFGDKAGVRAAWFVVFSMILIFFTNYLVYRPSKISRRGFVTNFDIQNGATNLGNLLLLLVVIVFSYLIYINYNNLSWFRAQSESIDLNFAILLGVFKISVGILLVIYICIREGGGRSFGFSIPIFLIYISLFLICAVKLGNRTDPTALIVGVMFYESSNRKLNIKLVLRVVFLLSLSIVSISAIEYFRYEGFYSSASITERIIKNDYFAPAHMLFAAVGYNFVSPQEVIESNFNNALILMNYPLLQQTVTDFFNQGVATRSAGYAFFLLSEGYIFAGLWGVIYNAAVITFFVKMWNMLALTDSRFVNLLMRSVMATMAINLARSQSSYFVKYLYTYVGPVFIFAVIYLGLRFNLNRAEEH